MRNKKFIRNSIKLIKIIMFYLGIQIMKVYIEVGGGLRCNRCNNDDLDLFYNDRGKYYCRKCVMFGRVDVDSEIKIVKLKEVKKQAKLELGYELSNEQLRCYKELTEYLNLGNDVFLHAACGAGKTEIAMKLIEDLVNKKKKVCFAIARRQVVLEIHERLNKAFKNLKVVKICEGFTKEFDGDIVVCTMHQLNRYYKSFDVLILDEVDAFPFKGNEVLENIANNVYLDNKIYLSATVDNNLKTKILKNEIKVVKLYQRYHGYKIPEPKVILAPFFNCIILLYLLYKYKDKKMIVFVPTRKLAKELKIITNIIRKCEYITSTSIDKDYVIKRFRNDEVRLLYATTILERGVSFIDISVIIYDASSYVYDISSLIQMSGRVGRHRLFPEGKVIYLCKSLSRGIIDSIETIKEMNNAM